VWRLWILADTDNCLWRDKILADIDTNEVLGYGYQLIQTKLSVETRYLLIQTKMRVGLWILDDTDKIECGGSE
jgi:hypothetical protein